ncbi:hypothetical protein Phep_0892 [Pedobacter heparinus DSM 2366]|uniref:Uncharacterized protein n=1 Tax=Pedobacter heparinus (strain ATCC 13125 / DSM 2366 / CIP 104194 / JCM 7457 / NBRC 12017 / NCIMB 9290 / NRRL B-14731 / HIM 762-3) TaxID=485917 RepID=C6Y2C1_PEDHD|nr:hypothetical protein Phep_0892 [Pedobacter heparinus DSM 2366]
MVEWFFYINERDGINTTYQQSKTIDRAETQIISYFALDKNP